MIFKPAKQVFLVKSKKVNFVLEYHLKIDKNTYNIAERKKVKP